MRKILLLAVVACAAIVVCAEEESQPAAAGDEATAAQSGSKIKGAFTLLPFIRVVEGEAEVLKAGSAEWAEAEEGKFYPLGTSYRTKNARSKMVVSFGPECTATLTGESAFGTRVQEVGAKSRTIVLMNGVLELNLARNLPEGAFFITAPGFLVKNPAGESKFVYSDKGDGDEATVRCVTGSMSAEGRHFAIPTMRAADEFRIRTSRDNLETIIYGTSGDYVVNLDRGIVTKPQVQDDGSTKEVEEKSILGWHLSPKTKVRISRCVPTIGKRMSVAIMTFDAAGETKNLYSFAEGRAEVNSGELIAPSKEESEEMAKKAAEAAETTEEAAAEETSEAEGDSDKKENNNNEE